MRPHYHACLFNLDFKDQKLLKTQNGQSIFTSNTLSKLWPLGFSTIGTLTWQSAGYTARYIMKKLNGKAAGTRYKDVDRQTGEIHHLISPEYTTMSRRPGLGHAWFNKYKNDVYPGDFVVINGKQFKPPRYYDLLLERENPDLMEQIRTRREAYATLHEIDNTCDRLAVREKVQQAKLTRLPRTLEAIT